MSEKRWQCEICGTRDGEMWKISVRNAWDEGRQYEEKVPFFYCGWCYSTKLGLTKDCKRCKICKVKVDGEK